MGWRVTDILQPTALKTTVARTDRLPQHLAKPGDICLLSQYRDIIAIMDIWRPQ